MPDAGDSTPVLVLMGGPDAERSVSIDSGSAIADALDNDPAFTVRRETIDRPDDAALSELCTGHGITPNSGVVFPALHGRFGEGGPLQHALERLGVAFVGSGAKAARLAIDKFATKQIAAEIAATEDSAITVSSTWIVDGPEDPPTPPPLVVKPNFEGSTFGLTICRNADVFAAAAEEARRSGRPTIAEPFAPGRELTLSILERRPGDLRALPLVEIRPSGGLYDFAAKYERDDTAYVCEPDTVPREVADEIAAFSLALARRLGVRSLARADYIYDPESGRAAFLEINTMPGFTSHSLVPMAASQAGIGFAALCATLVSTAMIRAGLGDPATA